MSYRDPPRFFIHRDARPRIVVAYTKHHRRAARFRDGGFFARRWDLRDQFPAPIPTPKLEHRPGQSLTAFTRSSPPLFCIIVQPERGAVSSKGHCRLAKQANGRTDGVDETRTDIVREVIFGRRYGRGCVEGGSVSDTVARVREK